jgi:hypothetical protein
MLRIGFFLFDETLPFCLDLIVVHAIPLETNVGLELEHRNEDARHSFWVFACSGIFQLFYVCK